MPLAIALGPSAGKMPGDPATSASRPLSGQKGGKPVLDLVRSREAGSVVVWKPNRTFRNAVDCLTTVETWDRADVALHLADDMGGQTVDTSSAVEMKDFE